MNSEIVAQKRALVIRAGRLGDTIWGTTVIEPIRALLGEQTRIDIIVKRGMRALFEHDPRIETIFEIDHRSTPLLFSPTKLSVLLKSLQHPYDLAVDLETSSHFNSLMRHIRAVRKICAATLPPPVNPVDIQHTIVFLRNVLAQGVPATLCQDAAPSLRFSANINIADLIGNGRNYLCLHPGNSLLARGKPAMRSWPESHWRELIEQITGHLPSLQIVLIGEKSERALSEAITANLPGVINLAGSTSLQQLMAVLAHSRALITTDTGPAHIAAALATPVIAIFGPSNTDNTRPFASSNGWAAAIMKDIGCNPCVDTERAKTCTDNKCMQIVKPSDVVKLLDEALSKRPVAQIIPVDNSCVK
jgi:ADP-heptose:LPS heptosyltransferase